MGMDCCWVFKVKTSGHRFFWLRIHTLAFERQRERDLAFNPWKVKEREKRERKRGGDVIQFSQRRERERGTEIRHGGD